MPSGLLSTRVLQHFSREDVASTLAEARRVVRAGGAVRIQMANRFGVRSFYHMARRGFRPPTDFDVRYWSPPELRRAFASAIGIRSFDGRRPKLPRVHARSPYSPIPSARTNLE